MAPVRYPFFLLAKSNSTHTVRPCLVDSCDTYTWDHSWRPCQRYRSGFYICSTVAIYTYARTTHLHGRPQTSQGDRPGRQRGGPGRDRRGGSQQRTIRREQYPHRLHPVTIRQTSPHREQNMRRCREFVCCAASSASRFDGAKE